MNSRVNQTVAVVDYGMGNLRSVAQAVLHATQDTHVNAVITADPAQVRAAHRVVLPGQGAMADCMGALRESGLQDAVLEAAATLRAAPLDRFLSVVLPLSRPALVTASLLGFAHTVGEFGVVLMVGGNIEGETRVLSVLLYDQVEAMAYDEAHALAAGLLVFSFVLLLLMQWLGRRTAVADG